MNAWTFRPEIRPSDNKAKLPENNVNIVLSGRNAPSMISLGTSMTITDIEILRDGGTILFTLSGTHNAGKYRLQTPFRGEPRPIFCNERKLEFGSPAEKDLILQLQAWLHDNMSADRERALRTLDALKVWRNPPRDLVDAIPLHRVRTVLECLLKRHAQPSASPNGGPAESLGNSGSGGGPPSVS